MSADGNDVQCIMLMDDTAEVLGRGWDAREHHELSAREGPAACGELIHAACDFNALRTLF